MSAALARDATALLGQLVAIDSVNPTIVQGGAGEEEIAAFVASWLERAGLEVHRHEAAPGRPNVVGVARGSGGGRSLLLNAHMDTVGVAGVADPHTPRVEGTRMYGRGAYDMKAGLAAIMVAGAEAARAGLAGDVIVAAVADEEARSVGAEALAREWRADAAVVTEPTELEICIAHRGFAWLEVETLGRAAHGSRPDLGVDAIAAMGEVLVGLRRLDTSLRADRPVHPLLGGGSVHAGIIEGGQEVSSYPERCRLQVERRTLPGETAAAVEEEIRALLGDAEGTVRTTFVRDPLETPADAEIVELLRRRAAERTGREAQLAGAPFWTDAAVLAAAGTPAVLFGPGGDGAHAAVEWADLEQLDACIDVLVATAADFCAAR